MVKSAAVFDTMFASFIFCRRLCFLLMNPSMRDGTELIYSTVPTILSRQCHLQSFEYMPLVFRRIDSFQSLFRLLSRQIR